MEYVCSGATLKCTMGTTCPKLKATPKNVSLTGKDQANIADYVPGENIPSFGRCRSLAYPPTASATAAHHGKLTPMPCVPGTCPKWKAIDKDSLICGEPALLKPATLKCMYGGTISIVNSGQTLEIKIRAVSPQTKKGKQENIEQEIPEELLQEFNELDTQGLDKKSVFDGVQLALDAAGMFPGLGAIPDLINASISVLRGDWVGAGLSIVAAVPGVGDVVGGAKIAYRGAKIAGKVSTKSAKAGSAVAKSPSNVFSIDSAKSANRTVNPSDIKSDNVVRQNFDDLSKRRAKNASIERQVEMKKVVGGDEIPVKKETYKLKIRDTSPDTIKNSIDDVGGGVNSNPSGFDKPHTVQSVKSPKGVTSDKRQNFSGDTSQNTKSGTQSKKGPTKIDQNKKDNNLENPNDIDSQKEIYKYRGNQPKTEDVEGYSGLDIST